MPKKQYALRTCKADMTSYNGFKWPKKIGSKVVAPDWSEVADCGNGLHGLLWGAGDGNLLNLDADAKWLVVEIVGKIIELNGKVKFKSCFVRHVGDRKSATDFIIDRGADASKCVGAFLTGGCRSTLTGGYVSTLTGGDGSMLTGGYGSTLTGGDGSTLTGGCRSTLTGGYVSTLTGGYGSTLTGGDGSTLTGGCRSTLTGGDGSMLTGGYGSTLTGGDGSTLSWKIWDGKYYRLHTFYVGENGVKQNTKYKFVEKLIEVK